MVNCELRILRAMALLNETRKWQNVTFSYLDQYEVRNAHVKK